MTDTSTVQQGVLRLPDVCAKNGRFTVEDELRRLHARVQELDAIQKAACKAYNTWAYADDTYGEITKAMYALAAAINGIAQESMAHTSTEQPDALRMAQMLKALGWRSVDKDLRDAAAELERLHARILELEAAQAQRVPPSADEIKEPKNGEVWRVEWWNESLRMMLPSDKVLHSFNAYRNGTIQFTLKARAHGIGNT